MVKTPDLQDDRNEALIPDRAAPHNPLQQILIALGQELPIVRAKRVTEPDKRL